MVVARGRAAVAVEFWRSLRWLKENKHPYGIEVRRSWQSATVSAVQHRAKKKKQQKKKKQ